VTRGLLAAALLLGLAGAGGVALLASPVYRLERVIVRGPGARWVTRGALGLGPRVSLPALGTSLDLIRRRVLAADPLARQVQLALRYPHTLEVRLLPRVAICLVFSQESPSGVWGVDPTGMLLPADQAAARRLPVCAGVGPVGPDLVRLKGPGLAADLRALEDLPPGLSGDVSEVDLGPHGLDLTLMDGRPVHLGAPQELRAKEALLPSLLARYPWPEYAGVGFDLSNPSRPALYGLP
jgi:cell division septal protein FtsQ